jgi:hypothetical protein
MKDKIKIMGEDFWYSHQADREGSMPPERYEVPFIDFRNPDNPKNQKVRNEMRKTYSELEAKSIIWYEVNQELRERNADFRVGPSYDVELGETQDVRIEFVDPRDTGIYVPKEQIPEGQDTISLQDAWTKFYEIFDQLEEESK